MSHSSAQFIPPLFFLLCLSSSLSFFVVEEVLAGESEVGKGKEYYETNNRDRTIGWENNFKDGDNGGGRDMMEMTPRTTTSVEESESETDFKSPRIQNSRSWNWEWNWDPEWEREMAAGLSTISTISKGRLLSTFLSHGALGRFVYLNDNDGIWISFTVTPCTSILHWSVNFTPYYDEVKNFLLKTNGQILKSFRTDQTVTFNHTQASRGFYVLEIRPISADSYIHIYLTSTYFDDTVRKTWFPTNASLEDNEQSSSLTYNFLSYPGRKGISVKELRGNRLSIKWETSPMNPQITHYCIVVNTRKDYPSLCGAQGDRYGVVPPDLRHLPYYHYKRLPEGGDKSNNTINFKGVSFGNELNSRTSLQYLKPVEYVVIGCLKQRRSYILYDLQDGQQYFINVFVKNILTNLSFPYLRTTLKYKPKQKNEENILKDSKPLKISVPEKRNNQTLRCTILKFNLKVPCNELTMYAMPCGGGSIKYEVFNTNRSVYKSEEIHSLDIIKIAKPCPGKYRIVVTHGSQTNPLQSLTFRKAEFLVSKKNKRFPLPKLPANRKIVEDLSLRTCDSVTIEWWPSPGARDNEYCFYLKKENRQRTFNFKEPNQCDLERHLKNDRRISHSFCLQRNVGPDTQKLRQRLGGLEESTTYVLQVVVRRQKGMALSYDLHHVSTTDHC